MLWRRGEAMQELLDAWTAEQYAGNQKYDQDALNRVGSPLGHPYLVVLMCGGWPVLTDTSHAASPLEAAAGLHWADKHAHAAAGKQHGPPAAARRHH
jgi:hypothetical protein